MFFLLKTLIKVDLVVLVDLVVVVVLQIHKPLQIQTLSQMDLADQIMEQVQAQVQIQQVKTSIKEEDFQEVVLEQMQVMHKLHPMHKHKTSINAEKSIKKNKNENRLKEIDSFHTKSF